jgi:cytochrome c-type biogenesis protein CcmF
VQSVHSFGENRELAWLFTGFMVTTLTVSFGFVIYRLPMLRARNELDSWTSREAAFLANNWVLLFAAFFVLFSTMFPTLSEALGQGRKTVAAPFFNTYLTPVGLILLFLTGVGPLLAWRQSTISSMFHQFLWPTVAGVITAVGVGALGISFWSSGLCFALCAFVTMTIAQEFWRAAGVRQRATGTDVFTALVGLLGRERRRYGGYIVHIGIVLVFLGFAGGGFEREEEAALTPGQEITVAPYMVRFVALSITNDEQKQMMTAQVETFKNGQPIGKMYPARWFFNGRESEPTTEVALRRGIADDLYVVLAGVPDVSGQTAKLKVKVNPLVNWIWMGVGVMAIGTFLALLPARAFAFAEVSVPEGAATAGMILILLLGSGSVGLRAQHVPQAGAVISPRTPFEKEMQGKIVCMCGTCGRQRISECTCSTAAEMRQELAALSAKGMTHDEIVAYYVDKWGSQEVLAAPIDKGFNRLAWLLPYGIGATGILTIAGLALKWSRRAAPTASSATTSASANQALEQRLDDELRDLD